MSKCKVCGAELFCKSCGANVVTKAPSGSGTLGVKEAKRISPLDQFMMLLMLQIPHPYTAREIQSEVYRWPENERGGKRDWNYHTVQIRLSRLVGLGFLKMSSDSQFWIKDFETMEWFTDKTPRYFRSYSKDELVKILAENRYIKKKEV